MPKRVSLKGRGADLFFGEESPHSLREDGESQLPAATEDQVLTPDQVIDDTVSESPVKSASDAAAQTQKQTRSRSKGGVVGRQDITSSPADVDVIEAIRQIVKIPGREVSYVRLTPEEKARLSDAIYTFKRQGQKTTETEINRIALNYLLNDYFQHGEQSVLARVIAALAL
jgi:hypothetical protein